jgi:hypothetical protein
MIYIDFLAGSHGNYLEFICNKFLANIPCGHDPFNANGASHDKMYLERKVFTAGHWFEFAPAKQIISNSRVVKITICPDDLLALTSISLLRAGDYNINNDTLEIDTYNKLVAIPHYNMLLNDLINSYFQDNRVSGYQAVKDPSWPGVDTIEDFNSLPENIKYECSAIHKLTQPQFDKNNPNCPRYILREFFKIGFKNPSQQGLMKKQSLMTDFDQSQTMGFPFAVFYNTTEFFNQLQQLANWLDMPFAVTPELTDLHTQFISRQPYRNAKTDCDQLLHKIYRKESFDLPALTLLQESYMNSCLEQYYQIEAPFEQPQWFSTSQQILEHFDLH